MDIRYGFVDRGADTKPRGKVAVDVAPPTIVTPPAK